MASSLAFGNGDYAGRDYTRDSVTEIAATMASRLARSRESGGVVASDTQEAETVARDEHCYARESNRLDERAAAKQSVLQMAHDQLPSTKPTADNYRGRVDACLSWAKEAPNDEVRLACLTLAQAWLRAAMRDDGDVSDSLPLAPKL
jgi:hypothetical protein